MSDSESVTGGGGGDCPAPFSVPDVAKLTAQREQFAAILEAVAFARPEVAVGFLSAYQPAHGGTRNLQDLARELLHEVYGLPMTGLASMRIEEYRPKVAK